MIPKWLQLALLTVMCLAIVLASFVIKATNSAGIVITFDATGEPRLYGLSLANTRVRGLVFRGLAHLGTNNVSVSFTGPTSAYTNLPPMTNVGATLLELNKAGLLKSSSPRITTDGPMVL